MDTAHHVSPLIMTVTGSKMSLDKIHFGECMLDISSRFMKDGDCDKFDAFVTELIPVLETFLHQIYSDCKLHEGEVAQAALQTFGFFLFQDDLTK